MDKVTKQNGVFKLEMHPLQAAAKQARDQHTADKAKLKARLTDAELAALLERILTRLEALELP
jgi:hypothetical protein